MPKGHNDFVATPQLNQFGAAYTPLNETDYSGAQSAGANVFGQGVNESNAAGQNQSALVAQLQQQANGTGGPTLAQQQLASGLAQNQAQSAGAIASQRGLNPALAARLIGNQQAAAGQQAAGQSAMLRNQEMLNAQGMLGQTLNSQRSAALNQGQLGGQFFGQAGQLQNAQNATRSQSNLGVQALNLQSALANQQALQNAQNPNSGVQAQNTNSQNAITGSVLGAAGAVAGTMLGGPAGGAIGAGAGKALAGGDGGGDIAMAPQKYADGGVVDGVQPERIQSFAELVAHHLTHQSHAAHRAMFGPVPASLSRGGMVQEAPAQEMAHGGMVQGFSGGGTPNWGFGSGGANSQDSLAAYQAAIAGGASPIDAFKGMSTEQKYALADSVPNGRSDLIGMNWDNVARKLDSGVSQKIPESQKQQAVPTPVLFNPGNFGGLATTNMAAQQQPGQSVGSVVSGMHNTWGVTPVGLGQALANGYKPPVLMAPAQAASNVVAQAPAGAAPAPGAAPAAPMMGGGLVHGEAKVHGDSPKNDTVPAMLSPGEVVIPRSASSHPDKAKAFVKHLIQSGQIKGSK